jgi:simple sugar transport system permease protein
LIVGYELNMNLGNLNIEPRLEPKLSWQLFSTFLALAMSMIVCAALLSAAGADVGKAFYQIYRGAFGNWKAILKTLVMSTPLILTGVAVSVAFHAKIWNIGAEGQLFAGAMAAYWASTMMPNFPSGIVIPAIMIAAFIGGGLYGALAGYLKARFAVNEVLSTVMLNYVIRYVLSFLLVSGPWRDPSSFYQQTPKVAEAAHYPLLLADSRLHLGFLVAVLAAVVVYVFISRTSLGYEIRAIGHNPTASRFKGIPVGRTVVIVMLISGGIAGLAGAGEVFGVHYRLKPDISSGFGFTGIILAMLAGLHPLGVIVAAVLFGGLVNGGIRMQIFTGVPTAMISAIEGVILLFFLTSAVLTRYEIKRVKTDG